MKYINQFFIWAIGSLFIFSGAIKINDPVGTAIKLEEYFDVFSTDFTPLFHVFTPYTLYLSIFLCAFEIILGVALLVNYKRPTVIVSLLVMIVFFTFLTFYSAYYNKVTDCGCFGTVIKLTPWQSFSKDIALLLPLLLLTFQLKEFQPKKYAKKSTLPFAITLLSTILSFGAGIYAYLHLPFVDTSDYKVGNHIPTLMKPQEPCQYKYIMTKDGKEYEFDVYPTDTTYVYKSLLTLNPEKCNAKITDYSIWNDSTNYTEQSFKGNQLIVVIQNVNKASTANLPAIVALCKEVKNVEKVVFTASLQDEYKKFAAANGINLPFYYGDGKVLKTMVRANPAVILLRNGIVVGKWHHNDTPTAAEIQKLL
jgi:uncharacterized membrane protein YphA (DoxX/SURF4 family)